MEGGGGESTGEFYTRRNDVTKVRSLLVAAAKATGEGIEGEVVVSKNQRIVGKARDANAFYRWRDKNPDAGKCDWMNGEIILREVPLQPHSRAQMESIRQFIFQDPAQAFVNLSPEQDVQLRVTGGIIVPDLVVAVSGQSNMIPGGGLPHSVAYAGIIIEIATSQRPVDLEGRAQFFMGPDVPTCEFYVGLKRYEERLTDGLQGMCAIVYERAHVVANGGIIVPSHLVSFGTGPLHGMATWSPSPLLRGVGVPGFPPCNAPGIAHYVLTFPAARVFGTRIGGAPAGAPNFTLDLFSIQQVFQLHALPL